MANFSESLASANAALQARVDLLDVGGVGTIVLYSGGTMPTRAQDPLNADGEVVASTHTLPSTAFASVATSGNDVVATAAAITNVNASATTSALGFYRAYNNAGAAVFQGDITLTGGGGSMTVNSLSTTSGVAVIINSWTIKQPTLTTS